MADEKSKTEIVLMPLVVAVVGIVGTGLVTYMQMRNADKARELTERENTRRFEADRTLKQLEIEGNQTLQTVELFWKDAIGTDSRRKTAALSMIAHLKPDLAMQLAQALESVAANGDEQVRKAARASVRKADERPTLIHPSGSVFRFEQSASCRETRPPIDLLSDGSIKMELLGTTTTNQTAHLKFLFHDGKMPIDSSVDFIAGAHILSRLGRKFLISIGRVEECSADYSVSEL